MPENATTLLDLGLFDGSPQHENFCRMPSLTTTVEVPASSAPAEWPDGAPLDLPTSYTVGGESRSSEQFLTDTDTAALLVLQHGRVRLERYALTGGRHVPWISMSVAKSVVSALVGIAVADGHITGIGEPISDYVPVTAGSAYDGVAIRDVLQMSSGARWTENYSDTSSDIFRLASALSGDTTMNDVVADMVPENTPGTFCRYNSGDTQVLGALLIRATGRSIADYMAEKLTEPLGTVDPAHWLVDGDGTEMAYAGLNMTARDYARIGELYRLGGSWNGTQIVPADWVRDSVTIASPHLEPGRPVVGSHAIDLGYGYQWWLPGGDRRDFSAIGVYNQFIYVDPATSTVIVKLSANRRYGTDEEESTNREIETITFLRALADATV